MGILQEARGYTALTWEQPATDRSLSIYRRHAQSTLKPVILATT